MTTTCCTLWSSVGKKLLTGITGVALVGFLIAHLIGNLLILVGSDAFNGYAYFLHHLGHGMVIYFMEAGLIAFFLIHIVTGLSIFIGKFKARPSGYRARGNAGGPSRKGFSSLWMAFSGVVILVFVVVHIKHFKYGTYYETVVHGETMRDVYRLVVDSFHSPCNTIFYVLCMAVLGVHLKHGVWSALQSLGVSHPRITPMLYVACSAFGVLLAIGFLLLPIIIMFFVEPVSATSACIGGTP